ncbi:MAG: 2-dehydropantoate 2-reductase [Cyanobacteria bacterium REEB67]|nr:2-dehydropantoate 2-reductase [Cyanobacteria bacterium REEB67]
MKIAMMGSGGVGGLFGARLAEAGADVHFIARGKHLAAIKENGLKIESALKGDTLIKPAKVTDDPASIGPVDYVLVSVKLWDTEAAAEMIKPLIRSGRTGSDTAVISLQNGVTRDQIFRQALGAKHVMGGISYVGATIKAPGIIEQKGQVQKLVFGEYGSAGLTPRVIAFRKMCEAADIEVETPDDIERALWEKFVVLVGMSTVLAASRQTIGPTRDCPETKALLGSVMTEVRAVAVKKGIDLAADLVAAKLSYLDQLAPDVTASMEHDLRNGNRLELPWLAGTVVKMGRELGVETPVCDVLSAILTPYVMGASK